MNTTTQKQPTRQDDAILRNVLLRLTAAQKILCTVVVAVVVLIWYDLLNRLIAFGHGMDYTGLHALGAQIVEFLKRYNPFFWWAVVVLCTLIIAYFLHGFIQSTRRWAQNKLVSAETVAELVEQLSTPARQVLNWAWQDRRNPITVGDLQRAHHELRMGRFGKIELSARQAQLLDDKTP
ncbi:MAG: hypothetical protein EPN76_02075 [Burkholderiaceae bacterium]|nr:MAG: hypothetical protein EPN76_02075 [Burkholderiaceae bacterium]TAM01545.1 MAG: hypothetical protein EPN67_12700 [Pusillimonas sp.]